MPETWSLACPRCDKQSVFDVSDGPSVQTCSHCKKPFDVLLTTVRAKKVRAGAGNRRYSIRVKHNDIEDLVEFDSQSSEDFEIRAGDRAAFLAYDNRLHVLHNLTLRRYMRVHYWDFPWVAFLVFVAIVVVVALVIWASVSSVY